jgi:hypothetical protein
MTNRHVAALAAVLVLLSQPATAQDLSRYRDLAFGSTVAEVRATTHAGLGGEVKAIHQRPALIQELSWRPQYTLFRPVAEVESAREIVFRFYNDQLSSIAVVYDPRLVEGMTTEDVIAAVSSLYGSAVLPTVTRGTSQSFGSANGSTALAQWSSVDYEFTLMREEYPATFRLVGVSKRLDALARSAETEAVRLDKADAPRLEAERVVADAERRKAVEEKARATNKGGFRP